MGVSRMLGGSIPFIDPGKTWSKNGLEPIIIDTRLGDNSFLPGFPKWYCDSKYILIQWVSQL